MRLLTIPAAIATLVLGLPLAAAAQDAAITNARIIVGSGQVIESGTILVRGGRIVSVTAGAAPTQGLRVIRSTAMAIIATPESRRAHSAAQPRPMLIDLRKRWCSIA